MNLQTRFNEFDKWLKSDEGKNTLNSYFDDMQKEEDLSKELETKSNLKYKDGQKVMLGDVFIDEYHEQLAEKYYGVTSYVYRINEDETIDVCFSSCNAWKANNSKFTSKSSRLVRRNGKLQSPFDGSIIVE